MPARELGSKWPDCNKPPLPMNRETRAAHRPAIVQVRKPSPTRQNKTNCTARLFPKQKAAQVANFLSTKLRKFENQARHDKTKKVAQLVGSRSQKLQKSPSTISQNKCTSLKAEPNPRKRKKIAQLDGSHIKNLHTSSVISQNSCTSSKTEPDPTKRRRLHRLSVSNQKSCASRQICAK